jgi:hypothetical protein
MIDILKSLIKQFMPFAQQQMGFSRPPRLFLRQDEQNGSDPMGKTGFYDPQGESITLYTSGRHPKDIMRSLAHELQHHTQKCNGDFENVQNMGEEGYAQANPHMRNMEIQAYQASIVFRDWEDSTKGTIYYEHLQKGDNVSMSTKNWKNGELKSLLSEAWGFKMDLSKLNEYSGSGVKRGPGDKGEEEEAKKETEGEEESKREEEELEEGFADATSGPAPRRAQRTGSRERSAADDCNPKTDPTCAPEPSEEAVADLIASRRKGSLEEEHDKDWGMDKGDESLTHPGEEDYEEGAEDPKDLAHELLALAHRMGSAVGAPSDVSTTDDHGGGCAMEAEEELEERRARGRKGPHIRGPEDPRLRESIAKMHKAGYSSRQIKEFLTKAYSKALRS